MTTTEHHEQHASQTATRTARSATQTTNAHDHQGGERLTPRQARVLAALTRANAPITGEALAAQLGLRAGSLNVTLRSLQRRALIAAIHTSARSPPAGCCAARRNRRGP